MNFVYHFQVFKIILFKFGSFRQTKVILTFKVTLRFFQQSIIRTLHIYNILNKNRVEIQGILQGYLRKITDKTDFQILPSITSLLNTYSIRNRRLLIKD